MPASPLNQVQVGHESAWATAQATATAKLMAVTDANFEPVVETYLPSERRGSLAPAHNAALSRVMGNGSIDADASYEDIGYYLEALFAVPTPSGAGPYTRVYNAPLTAQATPRSKTIQYGQTGGIYRMEGALVNQLTLSGESGAPMKISSKWVGTRVVGGALAALSDRSVNLAMGDQAKLYIDTWAGTMGGTEFAAAQWSWELNINPNRTYNTSLGSLYPISWHDGDNSKRWEGDLKLSLEFNATSKAYVDTFLAASPAMLQRQVRIKYSNTANYDVAIDFAGVASASPKLFDENNGLMTMDLTLTGLYHATVANWLKITVINQSATLA